MEGCWALGLKSRRMNVVCSAREFYGHEVDSEEDPVGTGVGWRWEESLVKSMT